MASPLPSQSTSFSVRPASGSDEKRRLRAALREATREVEDAAERLQMARTDVEGENEPIDEVESVIGDALGRSDGLQTSRARRIAESVAEDLETVVARLRRAADRDDGARE